MDGRQAPKRLAIAGLGAIGLAVARRVDAGDVPGLVLAAASVRDEARARQATESFRAPPALVSLTALADADVIVEGEAGPFSGLTLSGFALWGRRDEGRHVTFRARPYSLNGERRSLALRLPAKRVQRARRDADVILDA